MSSRNPARLACVLGCGSGRRRQPCTLPNGEVGGPDGNLDYHLQRARILVAVRYEKPLTSLSLSV